MKYISLILLIAFTLTLSGCFSKNEQMKTWSGADQEQELSNDDNLQEEISDEQIDTNQQEVVTSQDDQNTSQETTEPLEAEIKNESSASGAIEGEELESYEEDLEDLFRDILGELDDESASE